MVFSHVTAGTVWSSGKLEMGMPGSPVKASQAVLIEVTR